MPHLFKPWKHDSTSASWVRERQERAVSQQARRDARRAQLAGLVLLLLGVAVFALDLRVLGAALMLGGVLLVLLDSGWVVLAAFAAAAIGMLRDAARRMSGR
jgi:hypothetical protein